MFYYCYSMIRLINLNLLHVLKVLRTISQRATGLLLRSYRVNQWEKQADLLRETGQAGASESPHSTAVELPKQLQPVDFPW